MEKLHFEKRTDEAKKKFEDDFFSRPEYIAGEKPFEYQHVFSSGESLKAFQDEEGAGHVVIQRDGKTIFDFSSLLPPDFIMAAPKYFQTFPEKEEFDDPIGRWSASLDLNRKLILLGEFISPKNILSLLHEIGHINADSPKEKKERQGLLLDVSADFIDLSKLSSEKKLIRLKSKMERRAWAWAISAMRKVQKETGIPLSEIFPAFSDLKKFINDQMGGYRRHHEWIIRGGFDENFYKEMEKLFDRWKYTPDTEKQKT